VSESWKTPILNCFHFGRQYDWLVLGSWARGFSFFFLFVCVCVCVCVYVYYPLVDAEFSFSLQGERFGLVCIEPKRVGYRKKPNPMCVLDSELEMRWEEDIFLALSPCGTGEGEGG